MLNGPPQKFKKAAPKRVFEKNDKKEESKKEINETEVPSIENTKKSIDLNDLEVSNNDINPNRASRMTNSSFKNKNAKR